MCSLRHVGVHGVGRPTLRQHHVDGFLRCGHVQIDGYHLCAVPCGHEGRGASIADLVARHLSATDDDHHFSGEVECGPLRVREIYRHVLSFVCTACSGQAWTASAT